MSERPRNPIFPRGARVERAADFVVALLPAALFIFSLLFFGL